MPNYKSNNWLRLMAKIIGPRLLFCAQLNMDSLLGLWAAGIPPQDVHKMQQLETSLRHS